MVRKFIKKVIKASFIAEKSHLEILKSPFFGRRLGTLVASREDSSVEERVFALYNGVRQGVSDIPYYLV